MGVAITELVPTDEIKLDDLRGKTLAVDGYNVLYQFITTIRGPDGSPLSDSHGNVTSHLTGLFSRCTNLMSKGIRFIFVFDGKVPDLKRAEIDRRRALKSEAAAKFEDAKESKDEAGMKKYAGRTAVLTRDMVAQAKELLDALGIPWLDAPSEGEAQAAALVKQGHAWAVVSQDADALLYEAPRVLKNLAVTGRRKQPGKMAYNAVEPELIEHKKVLNELNFDIAQLRALALLVGTDYNIGGVKGIGPKKGLKLVQEHDHDFDALFAAVNWDAHCSIPWRDILAVFETMPVVDPGTVRAGRIDESRVYEILVEKHDFSRERVQMSLERLQKEQANTQKGLGDWF
ncbi:TPA: flap endonuclease-1 [Candidatus Woesearchaeota archaeon]|nr:flap endonuclease-1 [Candidatus Woesearchaeota archaeon]